MALRGPFSIFAGESVLSHPFLCAMQQGTITDKSMLVHSYDIFKNHLNSHYTNDSFAVHFASGMLAESVACIIYVPVDVIKERMQVQYAGGKQNYKSSFDAVRQIAKQEGLAGVYKGYGATLSSFGE